MPPPCDTKTFKLAQKSIVLAAEYVANLSMDSARDRLRILQSVDPSASHVRIVASYDGCYQMRSGKAGGGFSCYCFASAIAVDTAQVISYGIGCNSCHICTLYENKLKSNSTSGADYDTFIEKHQKTCQENYSHLSSVQLEIEHVSQKPPSHQGHPYFTRALALFAVVHRTMASLVLVSAFVMK